MQKWLRRSIFLALVLSGLAILVFLWISSSFFLTPKRPGLEPRHREILERPSDHGLALDPFTVTTPDGVELAACFAARAPQLGRAEKTRRMAARLGVSLDRPPIGPHGTVFILHGRSGRKEDMFAIAERFVAADYRCVVYDARSHGESGGEACTFGHCETADFSAVLDEAIAHIDSRGESPGQICAMGISLGASVILQSLPEESRLDAVVAVAPFATLPEVIQHSARRTIHRQIPDWLIAGTLRTGGLRAGFDPFLISPLRAVTASDKPVFFVHGALDEVIPVEHTERLHLAASGPKRLRIVPDGNHGNVLARGGDGLYEEMIAFCLGAGAE